MEGGRIGELCQVLNGCELEGGGQRNFTHGVFMLAFFKLRRDWRISLSFNALSSVHFLSPQLAPSVPYGLCDRSLTNNTVFDPDPLCGALGVFTGRAI